MLDAGAVEGPDEVLGGEVAGGALGVGAAAEAAGGRVDDGDARAAAPSWCWRAPGRRCRGSAPRSGRPRCRGRRGRRAGGSRARRCRRRSCRRGESWSAPRSISRSATSTTCSTGTGALPRVAEAHRDVGADPQPCVARARATTGANISIDSATVRLRFLRAKVSVALPKMAMCADPGSSARSRPRSLGTRTGRRGPRPTSPRSASTSRGVGELRHPGRRDERRRLDRLEPGGGQSADELRLHGGRDDGLLVLQTVARAHLVDGDPARAAPGWVRAAGSPMVTA